MKKFISILCVLCLVLGLAACGGASSSAKSYNISDLLAAADEANPLTDLRDITEDEITLLMNLGADLYEEYAGSVCGDATTGAMNLVVKAAAGKAADVKAALETYRDGQVSILEAYAPDNAAILKEGRIIAHGDYVVMVLGLSADVYPAVDTALDEAFK